MLRVKGSDRPAVPTAILRLASMFEAASLSRAHEEGDDAVTENIEQCSACSLDTLGTDNPIRQCALCLMFMQLRCAQLLLATHMDSGPRSMSADCACNRSDEIFWPPTGAVASPSNRHPLCCLCQSWAAASAEGGRMLALLLNVSFSCHIIVVCQQCYEHARMRMCKDLEAADAHAPMPIPVQVRG